MSTPNQQSYPPGTGSPKEWGYLHGAAVTNPVEAITQAFKHIFTYSGRASPTAFWWIFLFDIVFGVISRVLSGVPIAGMIFGVIGLIIFFAALAAAARRLHDTDRSGFWLFLILFIIVGWIWLFVYYCQPGTPGPNKYDH